MLYMRNWMFLSVVVVVWCWWWLCLFCYLNFQKPLAFSWAKKIKWRVMRGCLSCVQFPIVNLRILLFEFKKYAHQHINHELFFCFISPICHHRLVANSKGNWKTKKESLSSKMRFQTKSSIFYGTWKFQSGNRVSIRCFDRTLQTKTKESSNKKKCKIISHMLEFPAWKACTAHWNIYVRFDLVWKSARNWKKE